MGSLMVCDRYVKHLTKYMQYYSICCSTLKCIMPQTWIPELHSFS
jgi:hypothetical protein